MSQSSTGEVQTFSSGYSTYSLLEVVGEGSFGKVTRCKDLETDDIVAVKFVKKQPYPDAEVKMMETIRSLSPDRVNIIRFLESFQIKNMNCLVFEILDRSLDDLILGEIGPLPLRFIRPIAQQLFVALAALQNVGILHTDIKPDNVMFVNMRDEPLRIKLIDFGSAIHARGVRPGLIVQPVPYRAPEVFFGLPLTEAIDIWGAGCVLAFLYVANDFFYVCNEYQMVKATVELVGQPEDHLISAGIYSHKYFVKERGVLFGPAWRLMTPEEYAAANRLRSGDRDMDFEYFSSLDDLLGVQPTDEEDEFADKLAFMYLMKKLLNPVGCRRISARQALQQPFVTMEHLKEHPAYLESSRSIMKDFPLKVPEPSSVSGGDEECWSDGETSAPSAPW